MKGENQISPAKNLQLPFARAILFPPGDRLFLHPFQVGSQFGGLPQLVDGGIKLGQSSVGLSSMNHAVTLASQQFNIVLVSALLPGQTVVAG